MIERVSEEREVKVAASEAWKVYGTLQLVELIQKALHHVVSKIDVLEGNGSAGTILHIFFQPGMEGGLKSYKEKFMVVDNEKRVKVAEVVEGGYLDLGFTCYRVQVEVIDKEGKQNECITRITIEYELKEEAAAHATLVSMQSYIAIMQVVADYLHENHNDNTNITE